VKRELDNLVLQMHASNVSYADAVREFKKRFILEVLARHRGNQCKAAEELGMHRNTLSRTLAELDLDSAQIRRGMRRPPRSVRPAPRPGMQIVGGGR
jgi:DNA-binding NtrC family response regulator